METYRRALSQLVCGHHLDIEVFGLRLASGLDEPLQHLKANKDRRQQGNKLNSSFVLAIFKSMNVSFMLCKKNPERKKIRRYTQWWKVTKYIQSSRVLK